MLKEVHSLPEGVLDVPATGLHDLLGGPTLIHLPGQLAPPLFVCVLLHGNETTGFQAVQRLLRRHAEAVAGGQFPRALSIFIGNTAAAAENMRRLDGQPDYNRVWSGSLYGQCPEQDMMRQVTEIMRSKGVFVSVDIHNNTGRNPHYACINSLEEPTLKLAGLFSEPIVYFLEPSEVQSRAFTRFCPAVTLECGQSDQADGVDHVLRYLEYLLTLHSVDDLPGPTPTHVFHTTAVVKVHPGKTFGFDPDAGGTDVIFSRSLEDRNFTVLQPGTSFAISPNGFDPLCITGEDGEDLAGRYLKHQDSELVLAQPVVPAMFTTNPTAVRQDCLCYFMEPLQTGLG